MIWSAVAVALLAQAPVDPNAPLPPGHPPLNASSPLGSVDPNAPLPPGHPAVSGGSPLGTVDPNAPLPPGHPSLGGGQPSAAPPAFPAGHPQVSPDQKAMSSNELLKKLDATPELKSREKTFEVAAALGKLYYTSARYPETVTYLRQALVKTDAARALLTDARRQASGKPLPSATEAGCAPSAQSTLESLTQVARQKLQAGNPGAAAACASAALAPAVETERVLANALFLTGDASGALSELDRAVALDDHDAEAAFLRGAVRLDSHGDDVRALQEAKKDFARALALSPAGPRAPFAQALIAQVEKAIAAGGLAKLDAQRAKEDKAKPLPVLAAPAAPLAPFANQAPPALSKDVVDAIQNTERTPELEAGLQKLVEEGEEHLARGRFQDALDAYKRVVPFQPQNGRAKAGMAWALVGLNKQPMADRIWSVAVASDPAAVKKLGETLKAKGDEKGAQALLDKLAH